MHSESSGPAEVANSADPKHLVPGPTRGQHVLGVTLVLSVACIWVISGEAIQAIYDTSAIHHTSGAPFFLTYYSVSLFSLCLLGFLSSSWRAAFRSPLYQPLTDRDRPSPSIPTSPEKPLSDTPPAYKAIRLAAILAPLFFLSNLSFNFSLRQTSVASASVISTLTTLFTLIFGALLDVEKFSFVKLIATSLVMAGVAIIARNDKDQAGDDLLLGDLISILSAAIYSLYTVLLTKYTRRDGNISMLMMLSFMGFFTAISAWPGFFILHFTKLEPFHVPSLKSFIMLTLNGLIGTVLSDFLWAKGVVLTTPLIGTLSLSLSVPLSIVADMVLGKDFNWVYFAGAALVFVGFIAANLTEALARKRQSAEQGLETLEDRAENGLQVQLQETDVR